MGSPFSAIAIQCIYIQSSAFSVIVLHVGGGVRQSCYGLKLPLKGEGCMHVIQRYCSQFYLIDINLHCSLSLYCITVLLLESKCNICVTKIQNKTTADQF